MKQHLWKDNAICLGLDTNIYFDKYEDNESSRAIVDSMCHQCPVAKTCFAVGISGKEWGVWGGVYLEGGEVSREFNKHKTKQDWSITWQSLTMEK
jgi:hypothetical protein